MSETAIWKNAQYKFIYNSKENDSKLRLHNALEARDDIAIAPILYSKHQEDSKNNE